MGQLRLPLLASLLIVLIAFWRFFGEPINPDPAWLVYAAAQVLDGSRLYVDIIELNPPLIVWLSMPAALLSDLTGLSLANAFIAVIFGLAFVSILTVFHILKRIDYAYPDYLIFIMTAVFCLFPALHFGQREHIAMMLVAPYLFLLVGRLQGSHIPLGIAVFSGLLAAIGFNIKPYFLAAPALLELYLLLKLRLKTFRRPEPYVIGAFTALYVLLIFTVTPEYPAQIVPYVREVYGAGIAREPMSTFKLFQTPALIFGLGLILFWRIRSDPSRHVYVILTLAAFGFALAAMVQMKGWSSHILPVTGLVSIGLGGFIGQSISASDRQNYINLAISGLALLVMYYALIPLAFNPQATHKTYPEMMDEVLDDYPETDTVLALSTLLHPFSAMAEHDIEWASSLPSLWMVPGVIARRNELGHSTDRLDDIEQFYWRETADGLKRSEPDIVLVDVRTDGWYFGQQEYDFLEDFQQSPQFREAWRPYEKVGKIGSFDIYARRSETPAP